MERISFHMEYLWFNVERLSFYLAAKVFFMERISFYMEYLWFEMEWLSFRLEKTARGPEDCSPLPTSPQNDEETAGLGERP